MKTRGVMHALAALSFAAALGGAACVTSDNRCLPGFHFVGTYNACMEDPDAADDAASDASSGDASPSGDDGGDASASGLGASCDGDGDCAGKKASYCLKDPTAPNDPGVCSVPQCTASDCGSDYSCCDCSAAVIDVLKTWPHGVCIPRENVTGAQSYGCVCQ